MNQQPQPKVQGLWVKLYLVPQTEVSEMPPYIVGFLTEDNPSSYVLSKVLRYVENDDFEIEQVIADEMNFINRTYVWRCQVLEEIPDGNEDPYNGEGGLG